ncbi:MAG: DMT family transporter [Gammaproteobacteria bacterium]
MTSPASNWKLGLFYSAVTAIAWGLLPIALKAMLVWMDAYTIVWYRFAAATIIAGAWLTWNGSLPRLSRLNRRGWVMLFLAIAGLIGNYVFYMLGLKYVSPGTTQVLIQTAPIFLLLGGVFVFREAFSGRQWLGLILLVAGLMVFFYDQLGEIASLEGNLPTGVALITMASIVWTVYALAQKSLQRQLTAQGILLLIYVASSLVLAPTADPGAIMDLGLWPLAILVFCSINTVIAYGSFAEAMRHWEASRISAVISLSPLLTIIFAEALDALPTGYESEESMDALRLTGALIVLSGSAICALGSAKAHSTKANS